jgi:RNA polymerase sigma-54 factor
MAVGPRITLRQSQRLTLTPAMRSALSLLRMPTDQLSEEIIREVADNPFLDLHRPPGGSAYDAALATTAAHDSLSVSLARQIDQQRLGAEVREAALYLISQLREDGYLDVTLQELAGDSGLSLAALEGGLTALQSCEPTGVGARNLSECLALQLNERGYAADLARSVVDHLEDFAQDRVGRIMRHLGLNREAVITIAKDIRSLTPTPVISVVEMIIPRIPELLVEKKGDGTLGVALNPEALPQISLLDLGADSLDSPQMQICFDQARHLARSLAARSVTLLRIGRHIVDSQSAFFHKTPPTIAPESQAAAAAALNMHASTLGRALAGKSLAAGGKTYALAQFFSRAVPTADGAVSAFDIQARIRRWIGAEDRRSPLTDETICAGLNNEGVDIARRTVAKYRKCMRIPSSFERRRRNLSEPAVSRARPK